MTSKTKKIAIVTSDLTSTGSNLLEQTCIRLGYVPVKCLVADAATPRLIDNADAVIYRRSPKTVAAYRQLFTKIKKAEHKQELAYSLAAFDKCDANELLAAASLPMPQSETIVEITAPPFLPGVVKAAAGNKGIGVSLVTTQADYQKEVAKCIASEGHCLYQEYIEESRGIDKRLIVCGSRVVTAMKRVAQAGEFRANIHLGASAEEYQPSTQESSIAIAAVQALHLPYGGVDIIDSDKGPLILEVNSSPGFFISTITGVDIAEAIVEYVVNGESGK